MNHSNSWNIQPSGKYAARLGLMRSSWLDCASDACERWIVARTPALSLRSRDKLVG